MCDPLGFHEMIVQGKHGQAGPGDADLQAGGRKGRVVQDRSQDAPDRAADPAILGTIPTAA